MVICTPPSLLKVFLKLQFHPKQRRVGFMYNLLTFFLYSLYMYIKFSVDARPSKILIFFYHYESKHILLLY